MADEYIKIAIAAADQKKEHENLAPQEIARTTTPPHCLTYSVRTTHLPSQTVSFNFNTAGKFCRSLRHRLLARGSIRGRALPFLAPPPRDTQVPRLPRPRRFSALRDRRTRSL